MSDEGWPVVSVITISFRDPLGLVRTRESIEAQEYEGRIEHVVIDGGSGEEFDQIASNFPSDVRWVSEPDHGRYDAMNKGIRASTGEVIWFLHSGDAFGSPRSVLQAVEALRAADGSWKWGYGIARLTDQSGSIVGTLGKVPFRMDRFALGENTIPHQAAFFTRGIIERVGYYDLEHGLAADQLFMLRCAYLSRPIVVPEFLCDFDTTGIGSSRPRFHHYRDMNRARRSVGVAVLRWHWMDTMATYALCTGAVLKTVLGRVTASLRR